MAHMLYISSAPLPPFFCFFFLLNFYGFLWWILTLVHDVQLDTGMFNSVTMELLFWIPFFLFSQYFCWWFETALDEFRFFSFSLKLPYTKIQQYKRVIRSIFRLECNNNYSEFTINITSSFIHSIKMHSDGNVLKIRGDCFKVVFYIMTIFFNF